MVRGVASKIPARLPQFAAAGAAIAAAAITGALAVWVFRPGRQQAGGSFWRLVFLDRATVGFARAAVVALAIYVIGSLAALLTSGRWIRSVSTGGLETDAVRDTDGRIAELEARLRLANERYERTLRLLEESSRG